MTIKKLTVAAAIAVGIATCSLNQAMADPGNTGTMRRAVTGRNRSGMPM